jgi:hypothetical protein
MLAFRDIGMIDKYQSTSTTKLIAEAGWYNRKIAVFRMFIPCTKSK